MSSDSGGSTEQTQEQRPWAPAEPYLRDVLRRSEQAFQQTPGPGDETAAQQQGQEVALNWADRAARGDAPGQNLALQGQGALSDALDASVSEDQRQALYRPVQRQFEEEVMPNISQEAAQAGQLGGTRQGVAEGIAARGAAEGLADAEAQLQEQNQQRQLQAAQMAPQMASEMQRLQLQPADIMRQIGQEQRQVDEQQRMAEWDNLQRLAQMAQGVGGMGGQTVQPGPTQPSTGQRALGGAATGAGIGTQIAPGWGTAIGAGVGGLGGALM